jgi:hypothetical protein
MSNTQKNKLFSIVRGLCPDIGCNEVCEIVDYIISKSDKKFSRAKFIAENPYRIAGKACW